MQEQKEKTGFIILKIHSKVRPTESLYACQRENLRRNAVLCFKYAYALNHMHNRACHYFQLYVSAQLHVAFTCFSAHIDITFTLE